MALSFANQTITLLRSLAVLKCTVCARAAYSFDYQSLVRHSERSEESSKMLTNSNQIY